MTGPRIKTSFLGMAGALALTPALQALAQEEGEASSTSSAVPAVTPVVETSHGEVQGLMDDGVEAYLGLRYGAAPIGERRFRAPQAPEAHDGIADATSLGAPCMQMYSPSGPRVTDFTRQIQTIFPTLAEAKVDNEDCLFLNVWTPESGEGDRPVMVWFHGGGYNYGSGGWSAYDGRNLAEAGDVVVITVNHRLNAFGYLSLAEAFEGYEDSGNLGNLDLILALEWVRDNAARFGGDPENVTIMGESGGGSKVSHLMATPAADGLFHKAIVQSGPGVRGVPAGEAAEMAAAVLDEAGVETEEALRAIPAEELLAAARRAEERVGGMMSGRGFGPVVDGEVLPRDPFVPDAPDQSRDVPLLIGWNKDEMTIFTAPQPWFGTLTPEMLDQMAPSFGEDVPALVEAYREAAPDDPATYHAVRAMGARFVYGTYVLADAKSRQRRGAPVYVYQLTWETPVSGGALRSPHTLDIPLMFDNVEESRVLVGPGDEPERMSEMMTEAWLSFARTGEPQSELLPEWEPYTRRNRWVMQLDLDPELVKDPERAAREILSAGD